MSQNPDSTANDSKDSGLKILVVDDNHDSAMALSMLLKVMGYQVSTSYDGKSAIAAVSEYKPRVILLDLGMPLMDGFEVCRTLRKSPEGSGLVIIAQSGWGQDSDRQLTKEAGFDHHLIKPIDTKALTEILNAL